MAKAATKEKSKPTKGKTDTKDTIVTWLKQTRPEPGDCLFLSQQPYVIYQDSIARTFMPDCFNIETVGPWIESYDPHAKTSIILDIFTRLLYQENQRRRKLEEQNIASVIRNENGN